MIQVLLGELSEQETEVILRPIRSDLVAHNGESVGHDSWGDSGDNVYASSFGGRQPQGLWRSDLQGNEECVLAGASISHNGANPEEDRFIVDELYHETTKLWMSRKGDPTPEVLCQLAADWWIEPEQTGPDHPHARFLPGVSFPAVPLPRWLGSSEFDPPGSRREWSASSYDSCDLASSAGRDA